MDAPQPRTVPCFNGEPIPRGVVILDVRPSENLLVHTANDNQSRT